MLFDLPNIILRSVFRKRSSLIARLIAYYPIGRIMFRASIELKKLGLLFGRWSQRAVEYPWLIRMLEYVPREGLILDVGCAESLLSHELIARKFRVVGIDLREYPFKNKRMLFLKKNILDAKLPRGVFDAIVIVSTIEHIGLESYGQRIKDIDGDLKVMEVLKEALKHGGLIFLTTPYIGRGPCRIMAGERHYNDERLGQLVRGLKILKADYFYPLRIGKRRLYWLRLRKEEIDRLRFGREPGIAALVLRKE